MFQRLGLGRGDLYPRVHVQMRASHVNVSACIVHIHTRFLRDTNDGQDGRASRCSAAKSSDAKRNDGSEKGTTQTLTGCRDSSADSNHRRQSALPIVSDTQNVSGMMARR